MTDAFLAVTNSTQRFLHPGPGAKRVMRFHRFLFRVPPTIVLQAAERDPGEGYAAISSACRALVGAGFRVIVDASHNSLSDTARDTKREIMLVVEPMSREVLEGLTGDLGVLIAALRAAGLDGVVWAVVGGNPADYGGILQLWKIAKFSDITAVVESFVPKQLNKAIKARDAALKSDRRLAEIYGWFASTGSVPLAAVDKLDAVRPSPDKVLREVELGDEQVLVPATPAMAVVLRLNLEKAPSLDALKAMLSNDKVDCSAA